MSEIVELTHTIREEAQVTRLVDELMAGNISEIKPAIDLSTELGLTYPQVESLLGVTTEEAITILEFLADDKILQRYFYDKLLFCPSCRSPNLRLSLRCPKCGSGNITKGRILEHFSCGNIGLEDEYIASGRYICFKCQKELRFLGTDYRSLGVNYKCHSCGEVFSEAAPKWECLKCSLFSAEGEAEETVVYSYRLNDEKRPRLEFELGPKAQFIGFLKNQGYEVAERAKVNGMSKSGSAHTFDILARRDDGLITHTIGIGIIIDNQGQEIGLDEVFTFDTKAYDSGILDKVLLVVPKLKPEARQFAQRQRIRVFEEKDLETFLASAVPSDPRQMSHPPFKFETRAKLLEYLTSLGYKAEKKATVLGKSGAKYNFDILAVNNDGIITHTLGIDILMAKDEVGLAAVSSFDTKAYDVGIHDKVLLVSPRLSKEARQFAQCQRIEVIEVANPARLA
jgi:hypothetical protein